jgi:hypothetical protein
MSTEPAPAAVSAPAPTSTPAPAPSPGASELFAGQLSPEAARAEIKAKIQEPGFLAKLKEDPATRQRWQELHRTGFPAAESVGAAISIANQEAQRQGAMRETFLASLVEQGGLTPQQIDEIRTRATVTRAEHDWATTQKDLMMKDAAWRRRFFDGDRAAKNEWHRVVQLSALPYA